MLNNDQVSSAIWFFVGMLIMVFSVPYGLGELRSPSTGFMPFLTGAAICILSFIGLLLGTRAKKQGERWKNFMKGIKWGKPLVALTALFAYAFLLNYLGFILSTALLVGFLLRAIHPQKWVVVVSGALLISLIAYVVFQLWLETQLPAGIFRL